MVLVCATPGEEEDFLAGVKSVVGAETPIIGGSAADHDISAYISLLRRDGKAVGAAAVQGSGRRSWLKLIGVSKAERGQHQARQLLDGVLASEARLNHHVIGLEVLEDNRAAIALYEKTGFRRRWSATLLIAPV